ncbi:MAG: dihydroxyacetone kinase subunit L [Bacteroidaceae bacterium]|nr:dihydroxyacetone kinase subunit L [Bacteroidaceae bacterium]
MTTDKIINIIEKISSKIQEEKLFLTELDNVIGDGDHGINLARGFSEVENKLPTLADKNPGEVFKTVGMTLVSTVGGASGPLYGTGFMKMGMELKDTADVSMEDFLRAFQVAIDGISMRGKSTTGEKTMLDAMVPAKKAMDEAVAAGKSAKEAVADGVAAAKEGIEFTKTIAATKGRASYLGERSIGHQDPGATSFAMMLEILEGEL